MLYTIRIAGHDAYAANNAEFSAELQDNAAADAFVEPIRRAYPKACINWKCRETGDFVYNVSWEDMLSEQADRSETVNEEFRTFREDVGAKLSELTWAYLGDRFDYFKANLKYLSTNNQRSLIRIKDDVLRARTIANR